MKLASFILNDTHTWGAVDGDKVIDMGGMRPTLRDALEAGIYGEIAERVEEHESVATLDDVTLLPVIPNPDKIVCVGLNYKSHIEETGRSDSEAWKSARLCDRSSEISRARSGSDWRSSFRSTCSSAPISSLRFCALA